MISTVHGKKRTRFYWHKLTILTTGTDLSQLKDFMLIYADLDTKKGGGKDLPWYLSAALSA